VSKTSAAPISYAANVACVLTPLQEDKREGIPVVEVWRDKSDKPVQPIGVSLAVATDCILL
jgi:hypothetical protein